MKKARFGGPFSFHAAVWLNLVGIMA